MHCGHHRDDDDHRHSDFGEFAVCILRSKWFGEGVGEWNAIHFGFGANKMALDLLDSDRFHPEIECAALPENQYLIRFEFDSFSSIDIIFGIDHPLCGSNYGIICSADCPFRKSKDIDGLNPLQNGFIGHDAEQ